MGGRDEIPRAARAACTRGPGKEQILTDRLIHNGLSGGTETLRITGMGNLASNLE